MPMFRFVLEALGVLSSSATSIATKDGKVKTAAFSCVRVIILPLVLFYTIVTLPCVFYTSDVTSFEHCTKAQLESAAFAIGELIDDKR